MKLTMMWRALASPYQLSNFIGLLKESQLGRRRRTRLEHFTSSSHVYSRVFVNQMFMHSCLFRSSLSCFCMRMTGEACRAFISSCVCYLLYFIWGKCRMGNMNCFKSVYSFSMYCAINAKLQYSLTVTQPGVHCVQVTFSPHLSALQEVFSDWRSVVWYIYGDFCADRCIVFIVTFLYWIWSPMACYDRCF